MAEEVRAVGWEPGELLQEWLARSTYPEQVRERYGRSVERWLAHCADEDLVWDRVAAQHIALWAHRPGAPHSATRPTAARCSQAAWAPGSLTAIRGTCCSPWHRRPAC